MADLASFVVIAGQNGCGKSCIFDAIRLLKSLYGGYSTNEYHLWFGEFAINLQNQQAIQKLFRDPAAPIRIEATLSFSPSEVDYIRTNAELLVQPIAWQEVTGQSIDYWGFNRMAVATQLRQIQPQLVPAIDRLARDVRAAIEDPVQVLGLELRSNGEMELTQCKPVEVAFQAYEPEHIGVIEYHSASRSYIRQDVGGINLDTRAFEDQRRQQRLYNWQGKYQNIKTELAASYVRNLVAREMGDPPSADDLNETLRELFQTFFPDKTYEGVRPRQGGGLEFPVHLASGETHDIDELSSGEKEILYGYLKLRNSTPRGSVILLDEPELHLNPSLLQGFADFYYRHLGASQGNQLWMVTHSDTLLRQAVGNSNYRVYQMLMAASTEEGTNQAIEVVADDDVERVTIELIGDLALYRPHGKVVILEGETENGFDVNMVRRLFPQFAKRVNLVSGGHRKRVSDLYQALRDAASQAGLKNRFFAIVDRDTRPPLAQEAGASEFTWDVYHIENYLLDPGSIGAATASLMGWSAAETDEQVLSRLHDCAQGLLEQLTLERLQDEIDGDFVASMKIRASPTTRNPAVDLLPSIEGSLRRINEVGSTLTEAELLKRATGYRERLVSALNGDTWLRDFPGRAIVRRYANDTLEGRIDAIMFGNAVLDKMVERGVHPAGMKKIFDIIANR